MKLRFLAAILLAAIPYPPVFAGDAPPAKKAVVRKTRFGETMTPHQIAVEDLARKHFGKNFDYIIHSQREDGRDHLEVTCKIARADASPAAIQSQIKAFAAAFHLAGFDSSFMAFAYETRIPDDLGNDKLAMLVHATLREGLAKQANWKASDRIKFHALFSAKNCLDDFRAEWESVGAATEQ